MALRIGAFLLASYNFVSATLIDYKNVKLCGGVRCYKGDRPEPTPSLGVGVKKYTVGDDCQGDCKEVVHAHGVIAHDHSHGHGHDHSHGSHSHDSSCSSHGSPNHVHVHDHGHGHGYILGAAGHSHGPHAHGPHTHDYDSHHYGNSPHHHSHVNINSKFVNFKQIGNVNKVDPNFVKSHITNVNIPLVSSVGDTKHKKYKNFNQDRSNLPEHRNYKNYRAKKNLLDHDNLLKTAVKPVKKVSVDLKSQSNRSVSRSSSPIKYKAVIPGRLQRKTFRQVAIGQHMENANPVITKFGAKKSPGRNHHAHHHENDGHDHGHGYIAHGHDHDHGLAYSHRISHIHGLGHTHDDDSHSHAHSPIPKVVKSVKKAESVSHDDDSSSDNAKYWLGMKPGKWYDAKAKDYAKLSYRHRYHSLGHYAYNHKHGYGKKVVKVVKSPVIVGTTITKGTIIKGTTIKGYGYHH